METAKLKYLFTIIIAIIIGIACYFIFKDYGHVVVLDNQIFVWRKTTIKR